MVALLSVWPLLLKLCISLDHSRLLTAKGRPTHQLADLTFQVLNTVQLPLAAALGGDAVLAAPADVVNKL